MKIRVYVVFLSLIHILSACSSSDMSIGSDFNPDIDFDSFSSYRWHEGNEFNLMSEQYLSNELIDQRIRSNVDREMRAKGFFRRESGPVDFLVNYSITTADSLNIETYNRYAGYAPGWTYSYASTGPYHYGGPGIRYSEVISDTTITQYSQGTLVLDIVLPETEILIWRGIAEGKIEQSMNRSEREELVREATSRMLQNFPPQ